MKTRILLLLLLAAAFSGCAWSRFQLPKEFKSRKLVEDPPITLAPQPERGRALS